MSSLMLFSDVSNSFLRKFLPNFPTYSHDTWAYPERKIRRWQDSSIILGPPINLYDFQPDKNCSIHVSGIPNWAKMEDLVEIFQKFGKFFTIELSVSLGSVETNPYSIWTKNPLCNGWAIIKYITIDSAQRALFNHLSLSIPGMVGKLSIYKGTVNNVVILKNLPVKNVSKGQILAILNEYPGLVSISFIKGNAARMSFLDLDSALLFMDVVSAGKIVINGFTCSVEIEDKTEQDDDEELLG